MGGGVRVSSQCHLQSLLLLPYGPGVREGGGTPHPDRTYRCKWGCRGAPDGDGVGCGVVAGGIDRTDSRRGVLGHVVH